VCAHGSTVRTTGRFDADSRLFAGDCAQLIPKATAPGSMACATYGRHFGPVHLRAKVSLALELPLPRVCSAGQIGCQTTIRKLLIFMPHTTGFPAREASTTNPRHEHIFGSRTCPKSSNNPPDKQARVNHLQLLIFDEFFRESPAKTVYSSAGLWPRR
jgi:hypothetical protein